MGIQVNTIDLFADFLTVLYINMYIYILGIQVNTTLK